MTDGKKSFILHNDYQDYFALLSREERGDLIMAVFDYSRNGVLPDFDGSALMAFTMIRNQIERDGLRYEARCERSRQNGIKGGRPSKAENNPENPVGYSETQKTQSVISKPRKPDNDNVNDNKNDNDNVNDNDLYTGVQGEKKTKPPKPQPIDPFKTFTDNPQILSALKDFEEMRKKIKKPMTDKAKQMLLTELTKLSTDEDAQTAILNQSILHNWQTVYALKGNDKQTSSGVFQDMLDARKGNNG